MSQWFRAYAETLNDPKIQTLPLDAFKAWHNAMYLAASMDSSDGNIGDLDRVSFAFRETKEAVSSAFHHLIKAGVIETVDETFRIVSWKKRQYKSDTSTERVKRFRKRSRNVTETSPDTETESDIETSSLPAQTKVRTVRADKGNRLVAEWRPETLDRSTVAGEVSARRGQQWMKQTFERFQNHWLAKTGRDACKLDWQKTWANWVLEQDARDGRFNGTAAGQPSAFKALMGANKK